MEGKRFQRKTKKEQIKIIFGMVILGILFFLGIFNGIKIRKESRIALLEEEEIKIGRTVAEKENISIIPVPIETIPEIYFNYPVIAKLELPKIGLETNVLKDYTEDGMKVCVSKFWGPEPNEIGNFCIAGHNYQKQNMFNHLIDLEIGDELYLTDDKNRKYAYTIYNIYRVKPQNVAPISQDTNGTRVVTLITCVNYSRSRLIVQAMENVEGNEKYEIY